MYKLGTPGTNGLSQMNRIDSKNEIKGLKKNNYRFEQIPRPLRR